MQTKTRKLKKQIIGPFYLKNLGGKYKKNFKKKSPTQLVKTTQWNNIEYVTKKNPNKYFQVIVMGANKENITILLQSETVAY